MPTKIEKDSVTGVETTGHSWDGLQELNNPLPRWWLYIFYATILFGIGYMVLYPSVPLGTSYFGGTQDYSARVEVEKNIAAAKEAQGEFLTKIAESELSAVRGDQQLLAFAVQGGGAAFAENCAPCHGTAATGGPGYPSLQDDDWIWGGDLAAIETTIRHGVRWEQDWDTRISEMPAFGADEILESAQLDAVANYVVSLSGGEHNASMLDEGQTVFMDECAACHGDAAEGNVDLGAPALSDAIWLYGGSYEDVRAQLNRPRHGVMPSWNGRLDETTIKMLAVYVHELGGGQ